MRKFKFILDGQIIAVITATDVQEAMLLLTFATKEKYYIIEHIKP